MSKVLCISMYCVLCQNHACVLLGRLLFVCSDCLCTVVYVVYVLGKMSKKYCVIVCTVLVSIIPVCVCCCKIQLYLYVMPLTTVIWLT